MEFFCDTKRPQRLPTAGQSPTPAAAAKVVVLSLQAFVSNQRLLCVSDAIVAVLLKDALMNAEELELEKPRSCLLLMMMSPKSLMQKSM